MARRSSPEYRYMPEILPQGDIRSFLIQSESDPATYYAVDLMAYDGEGQCTCDDYMTRVEPSRKAGVKPVHRNCKHIRAAFEHVGREFMMQLSEMERKGIVKPDPNRFQRVETPRQPQPPRRR